MKIILITQDEPFYLNKSLKYLIENLPNYVEIVGCIVSDVSPFGKKESFITKALNTLNIFGLPFSLRYAVKFLKSKLSRSSVKDLMKEKKINIIELKKSINSKDSLDILKQLKPDLLISIAGNEIFKEDLINLAPKGCLNLHTAMLPKYRGLMPTFWALKNKEKHIGVSIFFVDEGIDSGPIIFQEKVEVLNKTQEQLIIETKKLGMIGIIKSIELIASGSYELLKNDEKNMTYFSFPTRNDVKEFYNVGNKFF